MHDAHEPARNATVDDADAPYEELSEVESELAVDLEDVEELETLDEELEEGDAEAAEAPEEPEEAEDAGLELDTEAPLDEILRRALGQDEDEAPRAEEPGSIVPSIVDHLARERDPDEFLCRSCFLLKKTSQLASSEPALCRDCA